MTKNQELQIYKEAIEKLGEDSYSGKWLRECYAEIEREINSDHFIDGNINTFGQTKEICLNIIAETRKECAEILQQAKDEGAKIREKEMDQAERIRVDIADKLRHALRIIND